MRRSSSSKSESSSEQAPRSRDVTQSGHSTDDLAATGHSRQSGVESEDADFDYSYPSARAGKTSSLSRSRLNFVSQEEENGENEEEIPLNDGHWREDPRSSELVEENASYPKSNAFSIMRQHSRDKIECGSTGSYEFSKRGVDFLKDPPDQITMGRKIGLRLQHKKWYNPRAGALSQTYDDVEATGEGIPNFPSLQKAWAYFEHVVLTRYVVEPHNISVEGWGWLQKFIHSFKNFDEELERAQPGENQRPTKLYDAITTPHLQVRNSLTNKASFLVST
jgi:hypothetical protein